MNNKVFTYVLLLLIGGIIIEAIVVTAFATVDYVRPKPDLTKEHEKSVIDLYETCSKTRGDATLKIELVGKEYRVASSCSKYGGR